MAGKNIRLGLNDSVTTATATFMSTRPSSQLFGNSVTAVNHSKIIGKTTITVINSETPNTVMQQKQQILDKEIKIREFSAEFYRVVEHDHFEFGITSNVELLVERWIARDLKTTQLALAQIFFENQVSEKISIGILKIIAHVDAEVLSPTNRGIAMAALTMPSLEVRECAVRAYEYWEKPEFLIDLEMRSLSPAWLEEYKQTVIDEVRG